MTSIFAREPVFTHKKHVFAYQFIYRNGIKGSFPLHLVNKDSIDTQGNQDDANQALTQGLSIDELMQVNLTIINLLPDAISEFIEAFSPHDVIVELSEINTQPSEAMLKQIAELKHQGFKIIAHQHQQKWTEFMLFADFIKLSINDNTPDEIKEIKEILQHTNIDIVATNIHSTFQFEQCVELGIKYLQGFFFLEKKEVNNKPVPANKLAYLRLMQEVSKPDLDVNKLEDIFKQDPTLSFLLIKFINNPMVNKYQKITSIRHALNYLGELMVRRFVAIISMAGLNSDKPSELLNLSLSRAKYCELVNSEMPSSHEPMSAFLVGLFSLLDIILEKPMAVLFETLELEDEIEQALKTNKGVYWDILNSTRAIEAGNWNTLYESSLTLEINKETLFDLHRQAIRWQHEMTTAISPMFPVTIPKAKRA